MKINQIWHELEGVVPPSQGLLIRRYSGSVLPDVYIALRFPGKSRCIAAAVSNNIQINPSLLTNLRDIHIELLPIPGNLNKNNLVFTLVNNQHQEIFSVLCEDLVLSIASLSDESQLVKTLLNRFEEWNSLFDKAASGGLTSEEQRGLFGELFFLKKLLLTPSDKSIIINSWTGPSKLVQDFQLGSWAVEVKTNIGNNHQKIQINSERQLDTSHLNYLYLFHLSLEARQQAGETLNQIIISIESLLSNDFSAYNKFKAKLIETGYFDRHKYLYDTIGYQIREERIFHVQNDFPRIEEKELRKGVGNITYTIIVSEYSSYIKSEEELFENVKFI